VIKPSVWSALVALACCLDALLKALGLRTLLCNPPSVARGDVGEFWPLEKLAVEADVLSFHTLPNNPGPYTSWHLADADLLAALLDNRILINACRGAVVDNAALL
jgi:erythronate-4-phosphate dehydrogenase